MIYLRAADRLDASALAKLRAAGLAEIDVLPPGAAAAFIPAAARAFDMLFRCERIAAWVACDGDRVVGSSCAIFYDRLPYPEGSRHAEVSGVYVMPAYRNRGFASELVREVIVAARAAGARRTFLRPTAAAKRLYARLGFVETNLMVLNTSAAAHGSERDDARSVAEPLSGYGSFHEYQRHAR